MNKWFLMFAVALCAGMTFAQGKAPSKKSSKPNQMIEIKEITPLGGESDYLVNYVPGKGEVKIKHDSSFDKLGIDGWHHFEVAYEVGRTGTNRDGKAVPVLVVPEVEVTFAVLYDMTKSKIFAGVSKGAQKMKSKEGIGWEDFAKQKYALFEKTVTYTTIIPGKTHYAAVCVPPAAVGIYGEPIMFSVQIKVDGTAQEYEFGNKSQDVKTEVTAGAKIAGKDVKGLAMVDGKFSTWWERIQNLSEAVVKVDNILRDRSQTIFFTQGDEFYDQVKQEQ